MKIGLLPLYLALYDEHAPAARPRLEAFYASVAERLEREGDTVIRTPFCRLAEEFSATVTTLEAEGADVLMTLHMAYSPSLECIDALTATTLPIVVLDVTETLAFGPDTSPAQIMYNHGIHGVMDMCHMLHRRGVPFAVAAGHFAASDAPKRALGLARAALAARSLSGTRTLCFGEPFHGMGDFSIPDEELATRFGITVLHPVPAAVERTAKEVTEAAVDEEIARDTESYRTNEPFHPTEYREAARAKITARRILEFENGNAFTFNFNSITGFPTASFLAASEGMAAGVGYAGEGDTLTASFLSALLRSYPEANFTEFFCPDWNDKDEEIIKTSGHGGSDYLTARKFVECIREGKQPDHPFDLYSAVAMSSVAILAHRSMLAGGAPFDIPDFRNAEDAAKYENDFLTPFPDSVREGDERLPACSHPDYAPTEKQLSLYEETLK